MHKQAQVSMWCLLYNIIFLQVQVKTDTALADHIQLKVGISATNENCLGSLLTTFLGMKISCSQHAKRHLSKIYPLHTPAINVTTVWDSLLS